MRRGRHDDDPCARAWRIGQVARGRFVAAPAGQRAGTVAIEEAGAVGRTFGNDKSGIKSASSEMRKVALNFLSVSVNPKTKSGICVLVTAKYFFFIQAVSQNIHQTGFLSKQVYSRDSLFVTSGG